MAIKLYLISGFLGAGKTTFIRSLLQQAGGNIGIIVNEFGQAGIDGKLLADNDIQLVEVNNGSIFCACLKPQFVQALKAFSAQPIHTLYIESSGLADPSNMQTILKEIAPYLTRPYEHKGTICLIDCSTFLDYAYALPVVENQVKAADLLLLNKTDLAKPAELAELQDRLTALNPTAPRYETTFATLAPNLISQALKNRGFTATSCNQPQNRLISTTLPLPEIHSQAKLQALCQKLQPHIWRIKGFAQSEQGWQQIDVTANQIEITQCTTQCTTIQTPEDSFLVIIWRGGERITMNNEQ
jgi:G3E family GTPase